jgi:RND superfamily putative drug exporter
MSSPRPRFRLASWLILAAWIVLVVVFAPFGSKLMGVTNDEYVLPATSQTAKLTSILRDRFPGGDQRPALVVYRRAGGLTASDRRTILSDAHAVGRIEHVAGPVPAFAPGSPQGLVSRDGTVALTIVPIQAGKVFRITPTIDALREQTTHEGGLESHVTGFPAITSDYNSAIKEADSKLLLTTVALVLILLIAVYRSPILALIPLAVVGIAYSIVIGIVYLLNRGIGLPMDSASASLLLVLMFGAGTDYCLLLVSRYRSALRRHESVADALRVSIRQAAPPMLASALTVVAALAALLAGTFGVYRTLGPVNAIGITVVLLASLTLLPALLLLLGRRAFWPYAASVAPGAGLERERGVGRWHAIGLRVRRAPVLYLSLVVALLVAGAACLAVWKTQVDPTTNFRGTTDGLRGYSVLKSEFPAGAAGPTSLLVERSDGPVRATDVAAVRRLARVTGVQAVTDSGRRSTDGRAALLDMIYADDPFAGPALDRTEQVRAAVHDAAPNVTVLVGGGSAERVDLRDASIRDTKVIVPIVLLVVLLTLILLLRALVAPLYLLATVILSFAGTLGICLVAFKLILGKDDFSPALPLIIFILLVALGSDYNIFLMSRIREEAAQHGTSEGTLRALSATGPVITSAGVILAGTFSVLIVIPSYDLDLIGLTVAIGVLLDTFVVRSVAVPAIAWIVGDASWWPSTVEQGRHTVMTRAYTREELMGIKQKGRTDSGTA